MTTLPQPRHYQKDSDQEGRDLAGMLALLQAGRAAGIDSYYVHPGDLKWWLYYPPLDATWWEHIYLWDDPSGDSRLLGWALLDPHGETFDVFIRPDVYDSDLAAAMFAWAEAAVIPLVRAAGRRQTGIYWVTPEDTFRTGWLEGRGYRVTEQSVALTRSLTEPIPEPAIAEGFEVRPCRGLAEVEARARAQYGAFKSKAPFEQYLQRFTRFMQSPTYAPQADWVAAATDVAEALDGRIAAFCITWQDALNRVGLFEPVGAHPDFQRRGLGKAVMLAALRWLQDQGMQQAIVCTGAGNTPALQLYGSVGFEPYHAIRFYKKDVASG